MSNLRLHIAALWFVLPAGSVLLAVSDVHDSPTSKASPPSISADEQNEKPSLYDGRTLDQWRELIGTLELSSNAARRAVPGLIAICRDPQAPEQTRAQAAYMLGRIGDAAGDAVGVLEELLEPPQESDHPATARWAAKALSLFGPVAAEATPSLVELSTDDKRTLLERQAATEALGRIGGAHPQAIPTLIRLATGTETISQPQQVQAAAIDSLMFVGPAGAAAVPSLIRLTRSESADLRRRAVAALGAIGPPAGIASGALVDLALFDELPDIRESAIASLARIGDAGETALTQLISDQEALVRRRAAAALGGIERLSDASRQALLAAIDDADVDVRLTAAESLGKADHDVEPLIPVLLAALTDENRQPRMRAYRQLIEMRSHADALLPRLRELANDPRPYVRQVAEKAIEELTQLESGL